MEFSLPCDVREKPWWSMQSPSKGRKRKAKNKITFLNLKEDRL